MLDVQYIIVYIWESQNGGKRKIDNITEHVSLLTSITCLCSICRKDKRHKLIVSEYKT